jgi:hypothetical protein
MYTKKIQQNKGFTIIETLVAISILMIAIAGPLTIAHKGLLAALYAHDQVTASYLAQDAMEYLKNVRDNNVKSGRDWLTGFSGCTVVDAADPTLLCTVDTVTGNPATPSGITGTLTPVKNGILILCSGASCNLYPSANGFTHTGSGNSMFSRYFYVAANQSNLSKEAKITVVVSWYEGLILNQSVYEAEIFNISK